MTFSQRIGLNNRGAQLAGSDTCRLWCTPREEEVKIVVETALTEAHVSPTGLTFEDLAKALEGAELNMEVDIPSDY